MIAVQSYENGEVFGEFRRKGRSAEVLAAATGRSAEEIQRVQNQASNIILANSSKMTARVVQAVMETGQTASLKF